MRNAPRVSNAELESRYQNSNIRIPPAADHAAHRYGLQPLEDSTSEFLRTILHTHNVCLVFDVASLYCLGVLSEACCAYMDRHAPEVLASDSFLTLSKVSRKVHVH